MSSVQSPTLSVHDLIRARISVSPVAMPVNGALVARLRHITAVPTVGGQPGFTLTRLRALDSVIERMSRLTEGSVEARAASPDLLERQEAILEMQAELIEEAIENTPETQPLRGLLFDAVA